MTQSSVPLTDDGELLPRSWHQFRLLRKLGQGGMGIVYEAEEIQSGRHVALKMLRSGTDLPPEALARFHREGRIAAALSHPNCVFVYGVHQVDGVPAIATELVSGPTLEDAIIEATEGIPVERAVSWTRQILDGLEA